MAGYGGRADRKSGTPRSRTRWWALPSKCRCPAPLTWLSSLGGGGTRGRSLRWTGQRVRHFDVSHAKFVEAILQEVLIGAGEVAFSFLGQETECVDGLARSDQINPRLATLLVHQAELEHGRHVKRSHEALKSHFQFFGGMSAEFHSRVKILRGFAIRIGLFLLLSGCGSGGRVRFRARRSRVRLGRWRWLRNGCCCARHFLLRNFLANLALRRK